MKIYIMGTQLKEENMRIKKKKYAVVIAAVPSEFNSLGMFEVSKPLIQKYCEKTNSDLIILTEPKINKIKNNSPFNNDKYNYLRFEKNQIYDLFETYDKILRLDVDIVINPNAPNYFELEDKFFYVTNEEVDRTSEILSIKKD